jgi:hypothetical protein
MAQERLGNVKLKRDFGWELNMSWYSYYDRYPKLQVRRIKGGRGTNIFRNNAMFHSGVVLLLMLTAIFRISTQAFSQPETPHGHWPQWRGPNRNNVSTETGLLKKWPEGGPPLVWKVVDLGEGIASISIAGGRIYTLSYHSMNE